jgi:hypothetical protein
MALLLFQVDSPSTLAKAGYIMSAVLFGAALLANTFCLPVSTMLNRSVADYGDWFASPLVEVSAGARFYGVYRSLAIFRIICLFIAAIVTSYLTNKFCGETFGLVYIRLGCKRTS